MIYFVQRADRSVKIGYSHDAAQRITSLTFKHGNLEILSVRAGTLRQEKLLHRQLADYRIEGEWFSPVPEVLAAAHGSMPDDDTPEGSDVRVVILMQPELRDKIKALGKSQGRVLMRQAEHILKEHVAAAPLPNRRKSK